MLVCSLTVSAIFTDMGFAGVVSICLNRFLPSNANFTLQSQIWHKVKEGMCLWKLRKLGGKTGRV